MGIKLHRLPWVWMLFCCYSQSLIALTETERLKQLVDSGDIEQAYSYAQPLLIQWEGDPVFDFYYGLAAIDTGHASEGVFALERVLFIYPDNGRARLELARGYFLLGEDTRARQEFSTVLASTPPPNVVANIERFLDAIRSRETRYRLSANAYVEYGLGHDTNVNSAPSGANFFSPFLGMQGTLNDASIQAHDLFQQVSMGAQINKPLKPGFAAFAKIDMQSRDNQDREDFDTDSLTFQGGLSVRRDTNQYRVSLQRQRFFVGNSANRDLLGLNGEWTYLYNERTRIASFLQLADLKNPGQEIRDAKLISLGTSFSRGWNVLFAPITSATLIGGRENANEHSNEARALAERDFFGIRLNTQAHINSKVSINGGVFFQHGKYATESQLFAKRREDDFYSADAGITWLVHKHWQLRGALLYSKNDSNIVISEYDRLHGQIKLRVEF